MSKLEYGFKRAVSEIIGGIVAYYFIAALISTGLIPPYFVLLFHLVNVLSTILLVFAMPFWATSYILGWLFGLGIMYQSGVIGILDLLIYLVPLVILAIRFSKRISD